MFEARARELQCEKEKLSIELTEREHVVSDAQGQIAEQNLFSLLVQHRLQSCGGAEEGRLEEVSCGGPTGTSESS